MKRWSGFMQIILIPLCIDSFDFKDADYEQTSNGNNSGSGVGFCVG
jgi:hypothetical protein